MIKTFTKSLFVTAILLFTHNVRAFDFYAVNNGDTLYYTITSNTTPYTVAVAGNGNSTYSGSVTIPSSVTYNSNNYSVTSIGNQAFYYCTNLTSITIPNSITSIGNNAFYRCTSLSSITIPNSVTSIGNNAFYSCTSLSSMTIPNSVTSIDRYAFFGISNIIYNGNATGNPWGASCINGFYSDSLYYSDSSKTDLRSAHKNIHNVIIPNSVTNIGNYAFYYCTNLSSITIPNTVTNIENYAFMATSLTKTNYTGTIAQWCNIDFGNLYANPIYSSQNLYLNNQLVTNLVIPNIVDTIKQYAFSNDTCITSTTIPNSVKSIGNQVFYYCTKLNSIFFQRANTVISNNAFYSVTTSIPIYVPCGSGTWYSGELSSFSNIVEKTPYSYSASVYDTVMGSVTTLTVPSCNNNSLWTVRATANNCYTFSHWSDGNTNAQRTITLRKNTSLIAYFICDTLRDTIYHSMCIGDFFDTNGHRGFKPMSGRNYPPYYNQGVYTQYLRDTATGCFLDLVINLSVNDTSRHTIYKNLCFGNQININGIVYNDTGTYQQHLRTVGGCDSLLTIKLSYSDTLRDTIYSTICAGDTFIQNGIKYYRTGLYNQYWSSLYGCDSLIYINLTVRDTLFGSTYDTICAGGFTIINGETFREQGIYHQILRSSMDCDSFVTVHIIITNDTLRDTIYRTICTGCSFDTNGVSYYMQGVYTQHLIDYTTRCFLNLVIFLNVNDDTIRDTIYRSVCAGRIFDTNGQSYYMQGVYTQHLQDTATGYPKILVINITVNDTFHINHYDTISTGQSFIFEGEVYNSDTMFSYHYTTVNGCDSIVVEHISVIHLYNFRAVSDDTAKGLVQIITRPTFSNMHATFIALPKSGYVFSHWSDGDSNAQRTITVTQDTALVAYFREYNFRVISEDTTKGTVQVLTRPSLNSPQATFMALPNTGYTFSRWSDSNTQNPRTLTLTKDTALVAYFRECLFSVVSEDTAKGTVQIVTHPTQANPQAIFMATPKTGYTFSRWSDGNIQNPRSITLTQDTALVAYFRVFNFRVISEDTAKGIVQVLTQPSQNSPQATFIALPNTGYTFSRWSDGNTQNPRSLTITQDTTLVAYFTSNSPQWYNFSVVSEDTAKGSVQIINQPSQSNPQATFIALPNTGYTFLRWSDGNAQNPRTLTVTQDTALVAYFTTNSPQYTFIVFSEDTNKGTVQIINQPTQANPQVTFVALPKSSYSFVQWNDGNTQNPRTLTLTQNTILIANFTNDTGQQWGSFSVMSEDTNHGSVQLVEHNRQAILTAVPEDGFEFSHWSDGDSTNPRIITDAQRANMLKEAKGENVILIAHFQPKQSQGIAVTESVDIKIFPNPTSETVTIEGIGNHTKILVINTIGKTVKHFDNVSGTATFSVGDLPKGVYFVRVETAVRKLIVE